MAVTTAAAAGLFLGATAVAQAYEQRRAGRRAEREQRAANRAQGAAAQVENSRRRRMAIAQARMQQAANFASQGSNISGSSALAGAQGAISSGLGSGIQAANRQVNTAQFTMDRNQAAASAIRRGNERAGWWNAAGQVASTGIGMFGPGGAFYQGNKAKG